MLVCIGACTVNSVAESDAELANVDLMGLALQPTVLDLDLELRDSQLQNQERLARSSSPTCNDQTGLAV